MPVSEAQRRSNAKHDKENWQYITFKARIGSKENIDKAAEAAGLSINGFIRAAVSKAVEDTLGVPMEPVSGTKPPTPTEKPAPIDAVRKMVERQIKKQEREKQAPKDEPPKEK